MIRTGSEMGRARNRRSGVSARRVWPGGHQAPSKQVFLAFARCLRSHGISDFPDPDAQGQLTLQMISAAGVDLNAHSDRPRAGSADRQYPGDAT